MTTAKVLSMLVLATLGVTTFACSAPTEEAEGATSDALSSTKHSTYGITTFGGAGDYQPVACGGNSRTINQYFVASSQRYGCHVHLKLTTSSGKCVVVYTADAGPASYVESRAGVPVMDSSPTVTKALFGNIGGLGYSDLSSHPGKYNVHAEVTSDPVGPCSSSSSGPPPSPTTGGTDQDSDPDDDTTTSGGSSSGSSSGGSSTTTGPACSTDGQCNPGNNGSGKICQGGHCVAGCHTDAQCPGNLSCGASGQCE